MAPYYVLDVPAGQEVSVCMRITDEDSQPEGDPFGIEFEEIFQGRLDEADDFYSNISSRALGPQQLLISRQAYAGQ